MWMWGKPRYWSYNSYFSVPRIPYRFCVAAVWRRWSLNFRLKKGRLSRKICSGTHGQDMQLSLTDRISAAHNMVNFRQDPYFLLHLKRVAALPCEILNIKNNKTLKWSSKFTQMSQFHTAHMTSYYSSTVTMALSCIVSGLPHKGRKSQNLLYPTCIQCLRGGDPIGISQRCSVSGKLEWWGYHILKKVPYDDTLSRSNTVPQRDKRTDGRTEFLYINIARQHWCGDAR